MIAAIVGCKASDSGDDTGTDGGGVCDDLASACHGAEPGTPEAMCHDVGHDGDEAACAAMRDSCLEICGNHGSTGHGTHGSTSSGSSTGGEGSSGTTLGGTSGSAGTSGGSATGSTGGGASTGGVGSEAACAWLSANCGGDPTCKGIGDAGDPVACLSELSGCIPSCGGDVCEVIGALCHGGDATCHDLGHNGPPSACEEALEDCFVKCG